MPYGLYLTPRPSSYGVQKRKAVLLLLCTIQKMDPKIPYVDDLLNCKRIFRRMRITFHEDRIHNKPVP